MSQKTSSYCSILLILMLPIILLPGSNGDFPAQKPQWEYVYNCTNMSVHNAEVMNLIIGFSAIVFLLISVLILIVLLCFKQYKTTLQRLILLITIVVVLNEAGFSMAFERQFHYPGQEQFCAFIGYLKQCSWTMQALLTAQVALYLIYMVYKRLKGDPFPRLSQKKCLSALIEFVYLFAPSAFIIVESGYPYIGGGKYGYAVGSCWIQTIDKNCNDIGTKYQIAGYVVVEVFFTISVTAALVLNVVYCRMAYMYRKVKSQQITILLRQTLILSVFLMTPLFFFVLGIVRIIYRNTFALTIATILDITISPVVLPIGYLVYIYATRSTELRWSCCKCTLCSCHKRKAIVSKRVHWKQKHDTETKYETSPSSHPQNYPSDTFFNLEATGAFTSLSFENELNPINETFNQKSLNRLPYKPVPSSTYYDNEYTGEFTEIIESMMSEEQPLVNDTNTVYNTMA